MLRACPEDEYLAHSSGGVRRLCRLGQYQLTDGMDDEGRMRHFVLDGREEGASPDAYEVDRETMYELVARYLAGTLELSEYGMERSPGHDALLDMLEIATARARSGETEFSWEEFDNAEHEVRDADDEE